MGAPRRCEAKLESRGGAGAGSKTAEVMRTATAQWGPCTHVRRSPRQGVALAVTVKVRYVMKVHHVHANLEKETREVSLDPEKETRVVPLDPEEDTREVSLDPKEETREVPMDSEEGTQKALSNPTEKTQEAPSDLIDEAQGTPSNPEEEILEAPSDPEEDTLEAPSDPEEERREVPLDHEKEAKDAAGRTESEGLVVPARRKLTIRGNLSPNNFKAHVESAGARRRGRSCTAKFSTDERARRRESMSMCDGGGTMIFQRKVELSEPIARSM